MLASIIANLQNVEPVRPAKLPMVKIDRGGGGPSWPNYDIVDITSAIQLFPEIAGEDTLARAVRRLRWIGEALPYVKEARERREGAVFLAGGMLYEHGACELLAKLLCSNEARPTRAPALDVTIDRMFGDGGWHRHQRSSSSRAIHFFISAFTALSAQLCQASRHALYAARSSRPSPMISSTSA